MTLDLAYERYGEDPSRADGPRPLLIAHGLFGSGRNWATLAKRFSAKRPVGAVDLRNHGSSPWNGLMDYAAMGEDLLAAADRLFGRAAILLGHSMGGKAAMAAALMAPDRVAGVIIADTAPIAYTHQEHGRYAAAMKAADLSAASKRSEIEPQLAQAIPDASLRAFILANLQFEQTDLGRRARWRVNLDAIITAMPDLVGWPAMFASARYAGSSLFLHGGASDYVTAEGRLAIERAFPAAEIQAVPGAGHWLHAEQPDAFFTKASAWLSAH